MKNFAFAFALLALAACNRDGAETPTSGANEQVVPTESMTASADNTTGTALIAIGTSGTDTSATSTGSTTAAQTTTEPPPDTAPAPTGDIAAGQPIFRSHCVGCHGADGRKQAGNVNLASAATQAKSEAEIARLIRESQSHRNLGLQETEISAVAAYVKALQ